MPIFLVWALWGYLQELSLLFRIYHLAQRLFYHALLFLLPEPIFLLPVCCTVLPAPFQHFRNRKCPYIPLLPALIFFLCSRVIG